MLSCIFFYHNFYNLNKRFLRCDKLEVLLEAEKQRCLQLQQMIEDEALKMSDYCKNKDNKHKLHIDSINEQGIKQFDKLKAQLS